MIKKCFYAFVVVLFCTATTSADFVFIDDPMDSPNYQLQFFNNADQGFNNSADISEAVFQLASSGGNPANYLEIFHNHNVSRNDPGNPVNGNGSTFVQSYFTNDDVRYNPANDGFIGSVSFSLDYLVNDPDVNQLFFQIGQTGSGSFGGFTNISPSNSWQTVQINQLLNSDFNAVDFQGSQDLNFGFGFLSNTDVTLSPTSFILGADNFQVVLTTVPEPACGAAMLAGGIGWLLRRRRKGV